MRKGKFFLIIAILFAINVNAQTPEKKWGLGLYGGLQKYSGDLGNGFFKFNQDNNAFGGLSISRYIFDHFDVELYLSAGRVGYSDDQKGDFLKFMFQGSVNAKYSFLDYSSKFRPFVFVGLGFLHFRDLSNSDMPTNMQLPTAGLGLTYNVTPTVSVVLRETFIRSSSDEIDGLTDGGTDMFFQHTLGVVFNIGKPKDTDGDGVCDKVDQCIDTPGLLEFYGCPDTDNDGIEDSKDDCPNDPGLLVFNGCPDSDGDSIPDKDDACPKEFGLAEFNGCPDTDGDGIPDNEDACPSEPGPKSLNGCPDKDGDGIADKDDKCPDVKGVAKFNGCPDTDGDGIEDSKDKCPKVAGLPENHGCPAVKKEVRKLLERALHGVNFRSSKAVIMRNSYSILDNVADIMKMNPAYKLKIQGHTDSYGNDAKNMQLSKDRAQAVKDYLIKRGVEANRLQSTGFGETKPIDTNKTSKGRAKNRRVEFIIQF